MAAFDLSGYFARVGYDGPATPTLAVLRALIACHTRTIPFEAIGVLAGQPVILSLDALTDKLIHRRRGGYCFEQNTLFRAALDAIGFHTTGLIGRVRRGTPREAMRPRTHMVVRVDLACPEDGHDAWLADVGYGGLTLTAPLALVADLVQPTPHETLRLEAMGADLFVQANLHGEWTDLYQVEPAPQLAIDYEVANWFTSTHPHSLFRNSLVVTRAAPAERLVLFNHIFSRRGADGIARKRMLTGVDDLRAILTETFGLTVTEAEMAAILALPDQPAPPAWDNPFG